MSNPVLRDALPIFLEWFPKIRESDAHNNDMEFQKRLKTAEIVLQSIASGLDVRDTLRNFAKELREAKDLEDETLARINGTSLSFLHLRIGAFSSLLAATWGVYDNILSLCALLLDCDQSTSRNLPAFLSHKNIKIPAPILGEIRRRYRYPIAYSYQIRNSLMHRLPFLSDWEGGFASIAMTDGYMVTGPSYHRLAEECKVIYKIEDGEAANFSFVSDADLCLLEVLDRLEVLTDECAVEILRATLHPLNQPNLNVVANV